MTCGGLPGSDQEAGLVIPMHVLVVTSMYPTEQLPHLGAYVAEQVRSLRAAGVEMSFCSRRFTKLLQPW